MYKTFIAKIRQFQVRKGKFSLHVIFKYGSLITVYHMHTYTILTGANINVTEGYYT